MGLFDKIKKVASDTVNDLKNDTLKQVMDSEAGKFVSNLGDTIGSIKTNNDLKKAEECWKDGGAWGFEIDAQVSYQYTKEGKWHEAYFYLESPEYREVMRNRYEPYMKFDWESIADKWTKHWKDYVVASFLKKVEINSYFGKRKLYELVDRDYPKERNFFNKIVDELGSFRRVPDKFIVNGKFDFDALENDPDYYNPFVNFFEDCEYHNFDIEALIALNNLFASQVIDYPELLGLDDEKILYDPQLYRNHDQLRICEIVAQVKHSDKLSEYAEQKRARDEYMNSDEYKNKLEQIYQQREFEKQQNEMLDLQRQQNELFKEQNKQQQEAMRLQKQMMKEQEDRRSKYARANSAYQAALHAYNSAPSAANKANVDRKFAEMMKYK